MNRQMSKRKLSHDEEQSLGVEACAFLLRHVHAPMAEITVHPYSDNSERNAMWNWSMDGKCMGNMWRWEGEWGVSVTLQSQAAFANLAPLRTGEHTLPTKARLVMS